MNLLIFSREYLTWHYSSGISALRQLWGNFQWFLLHFFAIGELTRTLFAPWHRLSEPYGEGFDIEERLSTLVVNGLMRGVGFMIRLLVIVFGVATMVLVGLMALVALVVWLFLPFVWASLLSFAIISLVG